MSVKKVLISLLKKRYRKPTYSTFLFHFSRPSLIHPIKLIPDKNITFHFSLRMVGNINPNLMPFFEALNPGFKIYIGDLLFFDYFKDLGANISMVSR